ncbi:unnamed protein product [Rotaria sp. Silwood2]|nr:unnamed protein product [Rotaria sp. Silwood2]
MYLQLIIYFLFFITITSSSSIDWETFKHNYNKQYASVTEEAERKQIFIEKINRLQEYEKTHQHETFKAGINHLMDRRIEELVSGSKSFFNIPSIEIEKTISSKKTIPTSLDWRDKGVITPVYNQGTSPKDSTVVAVEAIESFQAIRGGKLEKGSIDQVSDCCENTIDILDCILNKMGGSLCRESDYKSSNTTCDRNACQPFAVFNNLKVLKVANEYTMLEWIQDSPLYVGVNAADFGFEIYKSGVYSNPECANGTVDHVLQIVGYGIESGTPYWLCKNSWSSAWGDQGYIRLERGKNTCRIADYVAQVEYRTNDAVRSFTIHYMYLTIFSFILYIFSY